MQNQESQNSIQVDAENGSQDSNSLNHHEQDETWPTSQTNEHLLARLERIRNSRKRVRRVIKGVAGFCGMVFFVFLTCMEFLLFTHRLDFPFYFPLLTVVGLILFLTVFHGGNHLFYRMQTRNQNTTLMELAQRGEFRALGPLLEIMDVRMYTKSGWGSNRPAYISAVSKLLSHVGPYEFQSLTDAQIHQLTPLLCIPEPELYEAVEAALIRAGDARALHALRRMLRLTRLQKTQKFNPMMKPTIVRLEKQKMPVYNAAAIARMQTSVVAIAERVEADNRNALLLRASAPGAASQAELLRGAGATPTPESGDSLLRAAPTDRSGSETTPSIVLYTPQEAEPQTLSQGKV